MSNYALSHEDRAEKVATTAIARLATLFNTSEKNAAIRAVKLRLTPTCSRCRGSGQYSFNTFDGSRCFGCGGEGCQRLTEANAARAYTAAENAIADGRHEAYLTAMKLRREAAAMSKRIFAAWHDSAAAKGNPSHMKSDSECSPRELACRNANARIAEAHTVATKLDCSYKSNSSNADILAWKLATDKIFAVIDETNADLNQETAA